MAAQPEFIEHLKTLNQIAETLNRAVNVQGALQSALEHLIALMGLETGWIFLADPAAADRWYGRGYQLAAYHNLPPALALGQADAWDGGCDCQGFCTAGKLTEAYNEVKCSRLVSAHGDRRGLLVHASAPLKTSQGEILGIVNVAGPDWAAFSAEALILLTNVGSHMATTLERARLFDMLNERHIGEQAALLAFSSKLLGQLNLQELMDWFVAEVCDLLKVDASALILPGTSPERLVFQASCGWYHDPTEAGQWILRSEKTGPGLVMHTQRPLVIPNLATYRSITLTSEWLDWLQAEALESAVIVPLIVNGQSIGVWSIVCRQPRAWSEEDLRFLTLMANQAAIAIEKARLHQAELQQQRLEEELSIGRRIQLSLLPASQPVVAGWQFAFFYQPARQVGGDFYDFFDLPSGQLGIVIADIAGKGVPAAILMGVSRTIIRTTALSGRSPASALLRSNELILKDSHADVFLTAGLAALDTTDGVMTYASAGHNWPLWYHAVTGQVEELRMKGIVLGAFPAIKIEELQIELAPADVLVMFTDGVTEAMNGNKEEFGEARLQAVLALHANRSATQILQMILNSIHEFVGNSPQSDDLTLLIIKRNPK